MEAIGAVLAFVVMLVIAFFIALIPSFVLIWAYDYIAAQMGWGVLALDLANVVCVAVLLVIARSVFKKG